jgi:aryl-alcohol dehydrogenase-like predicted oxidoreductase
MEIGRVLTCRALQADSLCMDNSTRCSRSRREFLKAAAAASAGALGAPLVARGAQLTGPVVSRSLGRTGFRIPTLSLGGQGSLQWTGEGIDPVAIIVKAYELGVRYFDTSNVYGPSQVNYGAAFRKLGLTPGAPGYGEKRRREVFVATKSGIRTNGGEMPGVRNWTQGKKGSTVVDDVERSLSQLFGDGSGAFPEGAYLDSVQFHAIGSREEVDAVFDALDDPRPGERVGSLAVLRDLRDGTNRSGLNPAQRRLVRHIGITGHKNSDALMYAFWRDEAQLIDTLLVPANANDRRYLSHINNVIPVAAAKGVGVISMKVFSDGVFYGKEARFSKTPADVVLRIGSPELPSERLIQYPLSVPGVVTSIIGTGMIDADPFKCQLTQNLKASQLEAPLSRKELDLTEEMAGRINDGATNYFQDPAKALGEPRNCKVAVESARKVVRLSWDCALAAAHALKSYEIVRDGKAVGTVAHQPQLTLKPFAFEEPLQAGTGHRYEIVAIDVKGARSVAPALLLDSAG